MPVRSTLAVLSAAALLTASCASSPETTPAATSASTASWPSTPVAPVTAMLMMLSFGSVFVHTVALTFREHCVSLRADIFESALATVEDMTSQETTPQIVHGQAEQPTAELGADVMAKACASRSVLHHVTGRWGALTMVALSRSEGRARFGELRRAIEGISDRMLSQTLSEQPPAVCPFTAR